MGKKEKVNIFLLALVAFILLVMFALGNWFLQNKETAGEAIVFFPLNKTGYFSQDTDGDGLKDFRERRLGTDPNDTDTDNDGLSDYEEVMGTYGYKTDPTDFDSDNDGCSDGHEVLYTGTDPTLFGDCGPPPPP